MSLLLEVLSAFPLGVSTVLAHPEAIPVMLRRASLE
jgi:hypothetical protein